MFDTLKKLCGVMGIPGREQPVMDVIEEMLDGMDCRRDALGNLVVEVCKAEPGQKTVLLEAHADRIGLMVTGFLEDGFVRMAAAGGIDPHTVMGSEVEIAGIDGPLVGIVGAPFPYPAKPHNSAPPSEYSMPEIDALFVDTGFEDPKKHIKIGAAAVLKGRVTQLLDERVAAPGLDNRASCAALIEVAKRLKVEQPRVGVTVLFATREETSSKGAPAGAFPALPDEAIVVDTGFGQSPDTKEQDSSEIGGGPEIAISGLLDAELTDRIIETAKSKKIPCQTVVLARRTGTDADALSVTASGIRTAVVSIPIRFMHHPIETVDMGDIRATVNLLTEYVRGF